MQYQRLAARGPSLVLGAQLANNVLFLPVALVLSGGVIAAFAGPELANETMRELEPQLATEMELDKAKAERTLREHKGDVVAALNALVTAA